MSATLEAVAPVKAPARRLRVICENHGEDVDGLGIVVIEGKKIDGYYLCHRWDDMHTETRFTHEKDASRDYLVTGDHTGRPLTCSGRKNNRCRTKGGKPCKHEAAVAALVREGKLRTFSA